MAIRPFPIGIDAPPLPGTDRSKIGLLWASVEKCAQVIRALVGGKLLEYHEDELIDSTGQSITHNLGRLPRGWIITYRDGNRIINGNKERNTDKTVFMQTGAGAIRASFFLFCILLAAAPGVRIYPGTCLQLVSVGSATLGIVNATFTIIERP